MSSYCIVRNCRFSSLHISKAHICGKCGLQGHGIIECGSETLIKKLSEDKTFIPCDIICCIKNCSTRTTHTTGGHQCLHCKKYSHDISECPEKLWQEKVESGTTFGLTIDGFKNKKYLKISARNAMAWNEHKIYLQVYAGMGCMWFAKRDNNWESIKLFFMHSDEWGQYGSQTDRRPQLEKFLLGYTDLKITVPNSYLD